MSPKPPRKENFDSYEEYEDARSAYEDALDDYAERCIEKYYENRG